MPKKVNRNLLTKDMLRFGKSVKEMGKRRRGLALRLEESMQETQALQRMLQQLDLASSQLMKRMPREKVYELEGQVGQVAGRK